MISKKQKYFLSVDNLFEIENVEEGTMKETSKCKYIDGSRGGKLCEEEVFVTNDALLS